MNIKTELEKTIPAALPVQLNDLDPVSYTHLDAYKRQGICSPRSPASFLSLPASRLSFAYCIRKKLSFGFPADAFRIPFTILATPLLK